MASATSLGGCTSPAHAENVLRMNALDRMYQEGRRHRHATLIRRRSAVRQGIALPEREQAAGLNSATSSPPASEKSLLLNGWFQFISGHPRYATQGATVEH